MGRVLTWHLQGLELTAQLHPIFFFREKHIIAEFR